MRWLLALFGGQVVPFSYAGLHSGNTTRGLRFRTPQELAVRSADEYFNFLRPRASCWMHERRRRIRSRLPGWL